jgi:transposase
MGAGGAAAATGRQRGRPEKHPRRDIVDAVLYVVRTGCSWLQLPADFPPWQTVYWYFVRWEQQRVTLRMLDVLRQQVRRGEGRDAEPSAGVIDSQSVEAAGTVGRDTRGYDAGKKVAGRKRFIVTDTLGLLITVTRVRGRRPGPRRRQRRAAGAVPQLAHLPVRVRRRRVRRTPGRLGRRHCAPR